MSTEFDWSHLGDAMAPITRYAFNEVSHLLKKVAYDVYKPLNGAETLWELREDEDGGKYLYALYDGEGELIAESAQEKSDWNATSDREGANVTLSYKQVPLMRYASTDHGFTPDQADNFAEFLESKTADSDFLRDLLNTMPKNKRDIVVGLIKGEV